MTIPATATSGELARAVGVTERVIAGRRQDGRLPVTDDGRIDLAAVIRAGVDALARSSRAGTEEVTLDEARIRLTMAQADHREMLNEQMRGEAVLAEDMEIAVGALVDSAKAKVRALPTKAAPILATLSDPVAVRDKLTEMTDDICGDLAAGPAAEAVRHRAKQRAGRTAGSGEDRPEVGAPA